MHNYEDFFEEHFKRGNIVSNLSIISCWLLGLIQAVPLFSTWNYSCKISNFYTEKILKPTMLRFQFFTTFLHRYMIYHISAKFVTFCNSDLERLKCLRLQDLLSPIPQPQLDLDCRRHCLRHPHHRHHRLLQPDHQEAVRGEH